MASSEEATTTQEQAKLSKALQVRTCKGIIGLPNGNQVEAALWAKLMADSSSPMSPRRCAAHTTYSTLIIHCSI